MSIGAAALGDAAPPRRVRMLCKSESCAPPGVVAPPGVAPGIGVAAEEAPALEPVAGTEEKFGVGREEDVPLEPLSSVFAFLEAFPERELRELPRLRKIVSSRTQFGRFLT